MKVALVEDSREVREAMMRLLAGLDGVEVVGVAEHVPDTPALVEASRPDVVVLDVELRDRDRGIEVLRRLIRERPAIDVVVLSNQDWATMRTAFVDAGARAYFDKALELERAMDWIRARAARDPSQR